MESKNDNNNHFASDACKAIQNHDELAFILMLKNKWREEGLNYTEVSDFLKDYFNLTENISWAELHLYGLVVKEINQLENTELGQLRKKNLFLKSDVPFMGWAEMWYEPALYKISKSEWEGENIEPTEDDLRRLAYRNGQDYDEMKAHETPGRYVNEQGIVWNSVRDAILEIAGLNALYSFWERS